MCFYFHFQTFWPCCRVVLSQCCSGIKFTKILNFSLQHNIFRNVTQTEKFLIVAMSSFSAEIVKFLLSKYQCPFLAEALLPKAETLLPKCSFHMLYADRLSINWNKTYSYLEKKIDLRRVFVMILESCRIYKLFLFLYNSYIFACPVMKIA